MDRPSMRKITTNAYGELYGKSFVQKNESYQLFFRRQVKTASGARPKRLNLHYFYLREGALSHLRYGRFLTLRFSTLTISS